MQILMKFTNTDEIDKFNIELYPSSMKEPIL
jgi:hypothetical protein